jgi:hypothetical protein
VRQARHGSLRQRKVLFGMERFGRLGKSRPGEVRPGTVWQACFGAFGRDVVLHGTAWQASCGTLWHSRSGQGTLGSGLVGLGRHGALCYGPEW